MAIGKKISVCTDGIVSAMREHFEVVAKAELEDSLDIKAKTSDKDNGAEQWLDIYREKMFHWDTPDVEADSSKDDEHSTQAWLDIYREKRRTPGGRVERKISRRQSIKKPKTSRKELEQRIYGLIQRCTDLNGFLEDALREENKKPGDRQRFRHSVRARRQ